jgi:flagellar basal-body rod protein FlgG
MFSAATGMGAQQLRLDVIANNLANVNTTGFKKSRGDFEDLVYQTVRQAGGDLPGGGQMPLGQQVGLGVRPVGISKIFSQGEYVNTENEMDLAIEGKGFFKVMSNGIEYYTRAGNFQVDKDGFITTPNGDRLQPEFTVPPQAMSFSVDTSGTITVFGPDNAQLATGKLSLYTFANQGGLSSVGRNLFLPTQASGDPTEGQPGVDGVGTIAQGFIEVSNVNVVEEMVNMIIAQRAYELNSKAIQTADNMMERAYQLKS